MATTTINTTTFKSALPIDNINDLSSEVTLNNRFSWVAVDESKWSKNYPYQLAILKPQPKGGYIVHSSDSFFTLPVNPESLTISTPFASSLSVTLGGVVESNGGAPLRDITIAGTFGILPGARPSGDQLSGGIGQQLGSIFGGTIAAATATIRSAQTAINGPQATPNLMLDTDLGKNTTGYYQFRQLQKFLESYSEIKKTSQGANLRLALLIWKDDAAYIVTPVNFMVSKNAQSPHEYRYQLQFKAWKRIDPASLGFGEPMPASDWRERSRGSSWLANAFARVNAIRQTINNARDTLLAVRSDWDNTVGKILRQTALLIKDVSGLIKTLEDFPSDLKAVIGKDLSNFWDQVSSTISGPTLGNTSLGQTSSVSSLSSKTDSQLQAMQRKTDPQKVKVLAALNENAEKIKSGIKPTNPSDPLGLGSLLADNGNSWLAESIQPDNLPLSDESRQKLSQEIKTVRALSKEDFKQNQKKVISFIADYSDRVGLGDLTFNSTFKISPDQDAASSVQSRQPTDDDYAIIGALSDLSSLMGSMSAFSSEWQAKIPSEIEYIAGVANSNGIDMRVPNSKFVAPFPYGGSLEKMAALYLDDSQRWLEIAALNNLRPPYVDETGVSQPLITGGRGNEIVIADASRLTLGQEAFLSSTTIDRVKVSITSINKISDNYYVVGIAGRSNLEDFTAAQGATLSFFDRFTVHGGQMIYIPSDKDTDIKCTYALNFEDLTRLLKAGDIDGSLTIDGDLDIRQDGDWPFVAGINSIIQWCRMALSTPKGSMLLHPQFGIPLIVGQSTADLSPEEVAQGIKSMFANGPAFVGVRSIEVNQEGPTIKVYFELEVRGMEALLPISFEIQKS